MANNGEVCLVIVLVAMAMMSSSMMKGVDAITANVDCNQVRNYFLPCLGYLMSKSKYARPTGGCCDSMRSLNSKSKGKVRVGVCECIKLNGKSTLGINQSNASRLSGFCKIPLALQVSPNADCSKA